MRTNTQTSQFDIKRLYLQICALPPDQVLRDAQPAHVYPTLIRETLIRLLLKAIIVHPDNQFQSRVDEMTALIKQLELDVWSVFFRAEQFQEIHRQILSKAILFGQPIEAQLEWVGSTYESLLSLSDDGQTCATGRRSAAGVRRHREGAHYTPSTLVVPIVSATLDPLISIEGKVPSPQTILALRICDPAMGCGAFLIRSALAIARALTASWTEHKSPHATHESTQFQTALHHVIQKCIFGVDKHRGSVVISRLILTILGQTSGQPSLELTPNLKHGDALFGMRRPKLNQDRLSEWRHIRDGSPFALLSKQGTLDAAVGQHSSEDRGSNKDLIINDAPETEVPFHWHEAFPDILADHVSGFDAVLGNPPFGSRIDGASSTSFTLNAWWKCIAPQVAVGTFDKASLFLHLAIDLLAPNGQYGFILPRSVLSGGTAALALQKHVNQLAPPSAFFLLQSSRLFEGANVFVCASIGAKCNATNSIAVYDELGSRPRTVDRTHQNWWHMICSEQSLASMTGSISPELEPLSQRFTISAGCATGVAYELSTHVNDDEYDTGLKLVTTGLIDRFAFNWGIQSARFLKAKFAYPRWPRHGPTNAIRRAAKRQQKPKVLVGGLTKTLEAAFDEKGEMGGVVSTWAIYERTKTAHASGLLLLEMLLNSWVVTWLYHTHHGAQQSPWGGMTIKKAALLDLKLPKALFESLGDRAAGDAQPLIPNNSVMRTHTICKRLIQLALSIHADRKLGSMTAVYAADEKAQPLFAELYGIPLAEFEVISHWYQKRARRNPPMRIYSGENITAPESTTS
jgi:hypothetical protein